MSHERVTSASQDWEGEAAATPATSSPSREHTRGVEEGAVVAAVVRASSRRQICPLNPRAPHCFCCLGLCHHACLPKTATEAVSFGVTRVAAAGATAGGSGYFCRRRKILPVRVLFEISILFEFRGYYGHCLLVSVVVIGIRHRFRLRWLPGCRRASLETTAVSVQPFLLRFGKRFDLKAL
ncbi:uncharacterized protein DS421_2g42500 [Arachis hypogaea]|nr:uncharacterized protein DS421_2g42500 [Arachis hypogaea]